LIMLPAGIIARKKCNGYRNERKLIAIAN